MPVTIAIETPLQDDVRELVRRARQGRLTLVYGARDPDRNQAVALSAYLRARAAGRGSP